MASSRLCVLLTLVFHPSAVYAVPDQPRVPMAAACPPPNTVNAPSMDDIIVFTMAGESFIRMLYNWVLHMHTALPEQPYEVHATDLSTLTACTESVRPPGRCAYSQLEGERNESLSYYANPFYRFKVAVLLKILQTSQGRAALLLDTTSLVRSPGCMQSWMRYPEDIVISSSRGTPRDFEKQFGRVANTGALLVRPSALRLIELWQNDMPTHYDDPTIEYSGNQEHFNHLLQRNSFTWDRNLAFLFQNTSGKQYDRTGTVRIPTSASGNGASVTMHVRFLSIIQWPRDANRSEGKCLYHPYEHEDREARFRRAGWWYLMPPSPPPLGRMPA